MIYFSFKLDKKKLWFSLTDPFSFELEEWSTASCRAILSRCESLGLR